MGLDLTKGLQIFSLAIGVLLVYFYSRKAKTSPAHGGGGGSAPSGGGSVASAFTSIVRDYGKGFAQKIEQLIRLETGNFSSSQWTRCNTAGMVSFSRVYPFGWSSSLPAFVAAHNLNESDFSDIYFNRTSDGSSKYYVKFPSQELFIKYVAWFIQRYRGGDVGKWFTLETNTVGYQNYLSALSSVSVVYTV